MIIIDDDDDDDDDKNDNIYYEILQWYLSAFFLWFTMAGWRARRPWGQAWSKILLWIVVNYYESFLGMLYFLISQGSFSKFPTSLCISLYMLYCICYCTHVSITVIASAVVIPAPKGVPSVLLEWISDAEASPFLSRIPKRFTFHQPWSLKCLVRSNMITPYGHHIPPCFFSWDILSGEVFASLCSVPGDYQHLVRALLSWWNTVLLTPFSNV